MPKWNNPQSNDLFRAILSLKDISEARKFFRDLLTEAELIEFGKRWQAAQMLNNKIPYSEIVKKTGLSSTTVARISKWLKKGMGGYQLMLGRISHHHNSSRKKRML
ncbi:MAG: hypothetical protein AUJ34_01105 [Parcubacteria group bacterium CG1_02_41_12]|nr:MAG: hypothetical protein AUJ34_01105 [Parcubacteria group bacterium CG1_02_41_12]PIQ80327.1 MAG: hypothetical protein COV79_01080 [Parcubacteria group bacterium CG11_big_fil_rev_8_21_14_0_20_41_14]PIR57183.1 MAG: hypothetical protein COU72_02230 [Parcubacteria group bacterium CG10_big_fil_rev_8_21_14_0_10_41_35]PIZ82393.1 MAG: hypothetical protein COY02_00195 [Parcubacteria group bacterium CG_4_10_14_0_2_um_filter_41_6]